MLEHHLDFCRLGRRDQDWEGAGLERFERGADVHAHVFTPDSMRELLNYMKEKKFILDYDVKEAIHVKETLEFYAVITAI